MRENYTIEPQVRTARELAKERGWSTTYATAILDFLVGIRHAEKAYDPKTGREGYIINSVGLVTGEQGGFVKPFDPLHGYGDAEGRLPVVMLPGLPGGEEFRGGQNQLTDETEPGKK